MNYLYFDIRHIYMQITTFINRLKGDKCSKDQDMNEYFNLVRVKVVYCNHDHKK